MRQIKDKKKHSSKSYLRLAARYTVLVKKALLSAEKNHLANEKTRLAVKVITLKTSGSKQMVLK